MIKAELFLLKWERKQRVIEEVTDEIVEEVYRSVERDEYHLDQSGDRYKLTFSDGSYATLSRDDRTVENGGSMNFFEPITQGRAA